MVSKLSFNNIVFRVLDYELVFLVRFLSVGIGNFQNIFQGIYKADVHTQKNRSSYLYECTQKNGIYSPGCQLQLTVFGLGGYLFDFWN